MENVEWKIARSSETCTACQQKFHVGQSYYSVLYDKSPGFERKDYCARCFKDLAPESVIYYWRAAVAEEDTSRKPKLDVTSVLEFFRRLAGETDPQRVAFRYVLALMLARKKVLRLAGEFTPRSGAGQLVFEERGQSTRHEVVQPELSEDELNTVSTELGQLLGLTPPPPPATATPVPEPKTHPAPAS